MGREGGRTQINKTKDEKGEIITDTEEIPRVMRTHIKNLYSSKLEKSKRDGQISRRKQITTVTPR